MARAYAVNLWRPTQTDRHAARRTIEDGVAGRQIATVRTDPRTDHPATRRPVYDADPYRQKSPPTLGHCFPRCPAETWPRPVLDIVNNHHGDYYSAQPHDTKHPPGDWENPVSVYFLAAAVGTSFTFATSKRRSDVADHLVDPGRQWLIGALCFLGVGQLPLGAMAVLTLLTDSEENKQISETTRAAWIRVVQDGTRHAFHARLIILSPAFLEAVLIIPPWILYNLCALPVLRECCASGGVLCMAIGLYQSCEKQRPISLEIQSKARVYVS